MADGDLTGDVFCETLLRLPDWFGLFSFFGDKVDRHIADGDLTGDRIFGRLFDKLKFSFEANARLRLTFTPIGLLVILSKLRSNSTKSPGFNDRMSSLKELW